ncbi:methyltransferase [Pontibacillus sp. ALD_SL1]|uniref:methyltransferase n=1 Tax=Pontibacillus sp. ALD_SL1 TaxID=2777185 RepID=UPI001A97737C|nr:methyltransferase [Pontibacillus sp. ALD_SL1]QST00437.1 methyltransferase [Pontibacillus sp. ALD_SL1]
MITNAMTVILLATITFILVSIVLRSFTNGITPTPTSLKVKQEVIRVAEAYNPSTIADFGAGWGTMAIAFSKEFPTATVYAYETSLIPFLYMKGMIRLRGYRNIVVIRKDFFTASPEQFDLIYCYLFTRAMRELSITLSTYRGVVISNTFSLPGVTPYSSVQVSSWNITTPIYIYREQKGNLNIDKIVYE